MCWLFLLKGDPMKKIYFIEGLPGSGKTTLSRKLSNYLNQVHEKSMTYSEGDLHPVDLAWIAILNQEELNDLIDKYPSLEKAILNHIKKVDEKYYLAYTQVNIDESTKGFYDDCSKYEIYQIDDKDVFFEEHLNLWKQFIDSNKDNDYIYVFECIFMQNHINELLLKYDMSLEEIYDYYDRFQEVLKDIKVKVIYIKQLNIDKTLALITDQRRTTDKNLYKDWIDHVIDYFENSKYGKDKNYIGYDGALRYFKYRQTIELKLLDHLSIEKVILDLDDDYDQVFNNMIEEL